MQNIKNFTLTTPTAEMLRSFENESGDIPQFLQSEDGQDWYECQALFADSTVKIMYDAAGVIFSVVDSPVPRRGNTYAVSMFFPLNFSVAEITGPLPDGFDLDSRLWMYDGTNVYKRELTQNEIVAKNTRIVNVLLRSTTDAAFPLQSAVALGIATEAQTQALAALQQHAVNLASTNLTVDPVVLPEAPAGIAL